MISAPRTITDKKISKFSSLRETKEEELHIISAGPSARNFNWKSIRGKDIMTINDSIFYLPLKTLYHVYNEPLEIERERYKLMTRKFPFTHKFTTFDLPGWHQLVLYDDRNLAFLLAINLAIDLGYKKALLYGYDFDVIDGFIHWWDIDPEKDDNIISKKRDLIKKQKDIFEEFKKKIDSEIEIQEIKG